MTARAKLAVYALALVATFGAAYGVGAAVGPVGAPAEADHHRAPSSGGER